MLRFLGCVCVLAASLGARAEDVTIVSHPYRGVTHVARTLSAPDFPRAVKIHVMKIDTTEPTVSFRFTPHGGTRDTVRQTTLEFLNSQHAQVAINGTFFLPFPSTDLNADLVGFAASDGVVFSPFETPAQNYALVKDSPAINIDAKNHVSVVHRDSAFSDGAHVVEKVTLWNAFAGSAQIVTNGAKTIPCYVDDAHAECQLTGPGPANYSNSNSWYELTNARTAIGLGCDSKTLVLFTVDRANGSSGMKVSEVADVLIKNYDVCQALNMDGGGSTSLAMMDPVTGVGAYVNSSSDNPNGRVNATGLAVFAGRE